MSSRHAQKPQAQNQSDISTFFQSEKVADQDGGGVGGGAVGDVVGKEAGKTGLRKRIPCVHEGPVREDFIEEECESLSSSCTETSTSTGNLLNRIIHDPSRQREPQLRDWPVIYPHREEIAEDNPHQYKASSKVMPLNQMCFLRVDSTPNSYRQPAIIGTLGPSCTTVDSVMELLEAGMNIARVNMAHIDPCNRASYFQNVIEATNRYSLSIDCTVPVCIMVDLKGPEIRTGRIDPERVKDHTAPSVWLRSGRTVRLTSDRDFQNRCSEKAIFVDYEALSLHALPGTEIRIAGIKLRVESIENLHVVCRVEEEGALTNYQQVHVPMVPLPLPALTECDRKCLDFAVEHGADVVVVPKTRNEGVVRAVKAALGKKELQPEILVFAKISNLEGVENIDRIVSAADGVVIHKNDLGLEVPLGKIFIAQKEIIAKCNKAGKPVVCCVELPREGRDATHIAQCVVDGADCLLLTTETATGENGPRDVTRLCEVMREAEAATMQNPYYSDLVNMLTPSIEPSTAVALAAVEVANKIRAAAILTITTTGRTAQLLSWFRPRCPVIAVTRTGRVARQLLLWRAVLPLAYSGPLESDWFEDCAARLRHGIARGKDRGIIRAGDPLVLVTGYRKSSGFTNCLRVVFASLERGKFVENARKFLSKAK